MIVFPDFYPVPDVNRYPRVDIQAVASEDNPYNAWATKVTVKDVQPDEAELKILAGKRVVIKVFV